MKITVGGPEISQPQSRPCGYPDLAQAVTSSNWNLFCSQCFDDKLKYRLADGECQTAQAFFKAALSFCLHSFKVVGPAAVYSNSVP